MKNFTKKAASSFALSRYKIDDDVAGYTVRGRGFRDTYKKAVRLTRRTGKLAVRNNLNALVSGDEG